MREEAQVDRAARRLPGGGALEPDARDARQAPPAQRGRISREVLEESRREAEKNGVRHGEILVAMHALSEEQVTDALREQADEKFFEIFSWPNGTFRFERGARLERANALGLGRSPASLILHGVRSRFPLERIDGYFSSHAGRYLAHGESPFYRFQDLSVDAADAAFLRGIDGSRKLGEFRARGRAAAADDLRPARRRHARAARVGRRARGATRERARRHPPGERARHAASRPRPPPGRSAPRGADGARRSAAREGCVRSARRRARRERERA